MKHKTINGWTKELMKAQIRLSMWAKSVNDIGNCQYRTIYQGKPTACAVGCFIPDKDYSTDLEGRSPASFYFDKLEHDKVFPLTVESLKCLQLSHDNFKGNPEDCAEHVCRWIDENVEGGE